MNSLSELPVVIHRKFAGKEPSASVRALLEEIGSLIKILVNDGLSGYVDIRSIPLTRDEIGHLKYILGSGEVKATVDALGVTEVRETAIPAVWWITNRNLQDEVISEFVEVALMPEILKTQHLDLHDAPGIFKRRLAEMRAEA